MTEKLATIHPQLGKFDFYEAKKKRDWAYSKGIGSKEWIEFATLMFEQFPFIYNTCLIMNDTQNTLNTRILEHRDALIVAIDALDAITIAGQLSAATTDKHQRYVGISKADIEKTRKAAFKVRGLIDKK